LRFGHYPAVFPTRVGVDRLHPVGPIRLGVYSPHAWGWTVDDLVHDRAAPVFPTRVGVDRNRGRQTAPRPSIPHTRGGGPHWMSLRCCNCGYSPHAWGWTAYVYHNAARQNVFPTRVGVDRHSAAPVESRLVYSPHAWGWTVGCVCPIRHRWRIPHTRGGGPDSLNCFSAIMEYSPHAWGWTVVRLIADLNGRVFPTRVGVDRRLVSSCAGRIRIPHTRGGGPYAPRLPDRGPEYSPHAWGWTARHPHPGLAHQVFPTRVGVDRDHARRRHAPAAYSPHAWGWTVGQRPRHVHRPRIPHTRGGGPRVYAIPAQPVAYSPHAWGWTAELPFRLNRDTVFPTRVGVDREMIGAHQAGWGIPHTRGGGPVSRTPGLGRK